MSLSLIVTFLPLRALSEGGLCSWNRALTVSVLLLAGGAGAAGCRVRVLEESRASQPPPQVLVSDAGPSVWRDDTTPFPYRPPALLPLQERGDAGAPAALSPPTPHFPMEGKDAPTPGSDAGVGALRRGSAPRVAPRRAPPVSSDQPLPSVPAVSPSRPRPNTTATVAPAATTTTTTSGTKGGSL